jgi:predicted dehydrogenase
LKIGVIGVGVMGSNHARVLSEMAGVTLVGVVDPDRAQRELVGRNLGCAVFADLDALVESGVEAVTIAAPTHLHHDLALACIARGLHVLVEKPIAPTVEEGRAIVAAARRAMSSASILRSNRSSARSRARTFSRSPSPASVRFRRGCRMSAW